MDTRHRCLNLQSAPKRTAGGDRRGRRGLLCGLLVLVAFHTAAEPVSNTADPVQPVAAQTPTSALPQVTVQAQRDAIEPQVHSYLYDSVYLENDEGTARWNSPVCPEVVGLSHDQGEYILSRLSQIARAAGVPLAAPDCSPANLAVFATAKPALFLKKWSKARHQRMFWDTMPHLIQSFIETPRAVRVWYNSEPGPAGGITAAGVDQVPGVFGGGNAVNAPVFVNEGGGGSRLTRTTIWSLKSVFVVVDKTQLSHVKIGQLADYIGMNVLARLRPDAQHGDAPTILRLFQGDAAVRPEGMTPWDQAFLEAFYHTDQALVLQRGIMVRRMVSHIVPQPSPETASPAALDRAP